MIPTGLRVALRHLTTLPVPWDAREETASPAAALPWFPVVGVLIGSVVAAVLLAPLPAMPRAAIAIAVWTILTGALHEDAWMDAADAALAVVPRDRRLEILRDPHVGAHAVTALGIVLLLRFSALTVTPWIAPIVGAACGRWTMAITVAKFRPARAEGLGAAYAKEAKMMPVAVVGLAIVTALVVVSGPRAAIAVACALAGGLGLAAWLARRFGGLTGDGHGAAGLAAETIALLALVPLW